MICYRILIKGFTRKYLIYAVLMTILTGSVLPQAWGRLDQPISDSTKNSVPSEETANRLNPQALREIHLYFSDRQMQFLFAEKRNLFCAQDEVSLGRCILTALLEGPKRGLVQTLPKGSKLKAFYITDDGTAYADFNDALARNHSGGARSELLTVFSIVNSLTLNLTKINRVQLLIDGRQHETLAGHIAISDPFKANILLIR